MKKSVLITLLIIILILIIGGFVYFLGNYNKQTDNLSKDITNTEKNDSPNNQQIREEEFTQENNASLEKEIGNIESDKKMSTNKRIKLSFDNEELYVKLENNNSTQDFLKLLPLTIKFEDYNNTEKIAMLDTKLDTTDTPSGYDPQIGDFAYYAPWGNLSVFYKDFRYSNSLIKLGTFENGIDKMKNIVDGTEIKIEEVK